MHSGRMLLDLIYIVSPVFIIISIGLLVGRFGKVTSSTIKTMTNLLIFIFVPALVFVSTLKSSLGTTTWIIILFALFIVVIVGIIAYLTARILKLDGKSKSGFMLTAMFMNSGSMGSVICLIIFGENGFLLAIMFYVTTQLLLYTLGVFIASNNGEGFSFKSLKPVFTLPLIYALLAGFLLVHYNIQVPENVLRPFTIISQAAVPLLLITLGMQLSRLKVKKSELRLPAVSTAIRIGLGFFIAIALTHMLGLTGIERNVIVICAAMPTKITTFPIASKFGSDSEHVSIAIMLSTMISIITTPIVLLSLGIL